MSHSKKPDDPQVTRLLARMNLDEKLAQLSGYMFFDTYWNKHSSTDQAERIRFVTELEPAEMIGPDGLGFMTTQLRDLPPRLAAETANRDHVYTRDHTRHGIPVVIHDEGLHGLIGEGATVFPSALGMSASWNLALFAKVARAIGREARVRGVRQLLSPTVNLGIDPRCGRTEETYGEEPWLAGRFGVTYIREVQDEGVICTPKHFVANFESDGGRDSWAVSCSERTLREMYLVPFEACIREAGALSIMNAYNNLDGVPCVANHWLLTDLLRGEWGFEGYVVSDYVSVILQHKVHMTAETEGIAAKMALEAGMDVELPRFECFGAPLRALIDSGDVSIETIDRAVERVLHVKQRIGLMDDPFCDPDEADRVTNCAEHRALALEMAHQSIVLLKNEEDALPIAASARRIAVIGPNANTVELGDYTYDLFDEERIPTPLQGIRAAAPDGVEVVYTPGCGINGPSRDGFAEAVEMARVSDVAILIVGSSLKLAGEARDRAELKLPGVQEDLIRAVSATGTPVVVVMITGSVHTVANWIDEARAVIQGWYLGEAGAQALADVLFGKANPCGRLTITMPRTDGQCPVYHYHKPSGRNHTYEQLGQQGPVPFPFGHGLSYTTFEYSDLEITTPEVGAGGALRFSCRVTNTGGRRGAEVVQVYTRDVFASVARPLRELKDFRRVELDAGESALLGFEVPAGRFEFLDAGMNRVLEAGDIEVMVGRSSVDMRLRGMFRIV